MLRAVGGGLDEELLAHVEACETCRAALEAHANSDGLAARLREIGPSSEAPPGRVEAGVGTPEFPGYRLVRVIGRGGQGVVFEAVQESTQRNVAVKVLRREYSEDRRLRARIEREVAILGKLAHRNVCPVIDFVLAEGRVGVVMPYIEGELLSERIADAAAAFRRSGDATAAWSRLADPIGRSERSTFSERLGGLHLALRLVEQIGEALDAVHRAGVVHRDLKPENVIVNDTGDPVVLDFGLAVDTSADAPRLTLEGELHGTPSSMAPEQIRGEGTAIDARTDVYALGVLLYTVLAFEPPFEGPLATVLHKVSSGSAKPLRRVNPSIPRNLESVCRKAMDVDPARRYASAEEMVADLMRVRRLEPTVAKPVSAVEGLVLRARRNPVVSAMAVMIAVLAVLLGVVRAGWWNSVELVGEAYAEHVELAGKVIDPLEAKRLRAFLGEERFAEYRDASPEGQMAILSARAAAMRSGEPEGLVLLSPRGGVRSPVSALQMAAPAAASGRSFTVRLIDVQSGEELLRTDANQPADERTFTLRLPAAAPLPQDRELEWLVRPRGGRGTGASLQSADAVFWVVGADSAPALDGNTSGAKGVLEEAAQLLVVGLGAEAEAALERLPHNAASNVAARLMLARARIIQGHTEFLRDEPAPTTGEKP